MIDRRPYIGPTKLVVAFDIGTTYSGVSYSILQSGLVPEIFGVTRFPAQTSWHGSGKVPSLLYYDKEGRVRAAGAEVLTEDVIDNAIAEKWTKAEWWKLHLRPSHMTSSINKDDDLPPLPSGKSATDVLTDFIKYLFQCTKTYILERHLAFAWSTVEDSVEYIFTHPNGWEGIQQQMYRQAIQGAGLIPLTPEGQSRVHMLTDGEASLHFCASIILDIGTNDGTTPQGVVIIDAGGGGINVSMFSTIFNPISCEEIVPAECRLQGSVFVTCRARTLLHEKLRGWERSSEGDIAEFTREFDQSTKLSIKSDREPAYITVAGRRYNDKRYNISFGKLKLSGEEATGLFNDSIDAVINAFEQQRKFATVSKTVAFAVGGLLSNDWFWSRLQSYFKGENIDICRPDNHVNMAVANGAVLSYIDRENDLVAARAARATYGVVCAVSVDDKDEQHIRRKGLWEVDPSGDRYVSGYFETKIFKGTRIPAMMESRESFSLTELNPRDFGVQTVRLVCYRGELSDPKWVDEDELSFSPLCTIRVDLSLAANDLIRKRSGRRVYYHLDYDVVVFFGLTELRADLSWKVKNGERRAPAMISYS